LNRGHSSKRERQRGQSLVELALFIPVLAVILLTAIDLGRVYLGWVTLTNVARIGANFAAQNPDAWNGAGDATVQARYRTLMGKDATGVDCNLPSSLPGPVFLNASPNQYSLGSRVQVNLTCSFHLMTPLISSIIGDSGGNLNVGASAVFTIRSGSISGVVISGTSATPTPSPTAAPTPTPTDTPTPTPTPTRTPTPTPTPVGQTPDPGATPTPTSTATATPTAAPTPNVSFYGSSTSADATGGGPPGSIGESQIVGVTPTVVTFTNTTTGGSGSCDWDFGDGSNTSSSCGNSVQHTYSTRGTFSVTLSVQGTSLTRSNYVYMTCKVPSFSGVRANSAVTTWVNAGFSSAKLSKQSGTGNYKIGYQSIAGGLVNPQGGCSASITVGP
jgi:Flp pilus assembly protein TadG